MQVISLFVIIYLLCILGGCDAHKRHFSLSIGWMHGSPDGFSRKILAINNQYPGPLIEFNTGDEVTVSVFNNLTDRGTSLHWHGFNQVGTPYMDGVPGVTQCEIPPQTHYDYKFTIEDQWGTFWYHSHSGTQYMDGALGPIIVHNPEKEKRHGAHYDEDIIIILHDWYHTMAHDLLVWYMSPKSGGHEPNPDSALMNGMGKYNCSMKLNSTCNSCDNNPPMFKPHVKHDKKYRLRILNSAAISHYMFSVDNHNLTIIEADGVDIDPFTVKSLPINVGQRYSAILHANNPIDNYWIRGNVSVADLQPGWTMTPWVQGILHYESAGHHEPTSKYEEEPILKEHELRPYVAMPAPDPVGKYVDIYAQFFVPNETEGTQYAYMNNISFTLPSTPILQLVKHSQKIPDGAYVIDLPKLGEVVQVSLYNYDNGEHPFHLHGHNFSIIGKTSVPPDPKTGECNYAEVNALRIDHPSLKNPLRRDTATVAGCGLLVFRFITDNPGTWFFHCHIDWHLEAGLALVFNELPSDLPHIPKGTCT